MRTESKKMSTGKRILTTALAGAALAIGSVGVAAPASAADKAAAWQVVSTRDYCYTVSGWNDCYTETTWKRTSEFCAKPAGSLTGGLAAWYSYCYKTTTVRR